MIKYNSNTISDWNYGSDNIVKVYRNNAVCYYKITGGGDTPTAQTPCYAVVDDISQYQDTEFDDVYDKATEKWYKLNNLNQYEEYGIYGSGRTITYYEGKLTVDDETTSRLPSGYTEVEYITSEHLATNLSTGTYINTNYYPTDKTRVVIDYQATSQTAEHRRLFGAGHCCQSNIAYVLNMEQKYTASNREFTYRCGSGNTWVHTNIPFDLERHVVDFNNDGVIYLDNTQIGTRQNAPFTATYPMYLLTDNNDGTIGTNQYIVGRVYSCQMYEDGTKIRDFVPAKRDSDSKYGLYDIVNDNFYPSSSSYQFSGGTATSSSTTYEYMYSGGSWVNVGEVSGGSITVYSPEYLERDASHNGYVGLGEYFQENTKIEIDFQMTQAKGNAIIGDYGSNDNDDWRVFLNYDVQVNNWLVYDFINSRNNYDTRDWSKRFNIEIGNYYIKDLDTGNYLINTTSKTSFSRPNQMYLFHMEGSQSTNNIDYGHIYSLKIWQGDTLVKDFIPWTDLNGNYGLYDKVSLSAYTSTNQMTGSSNVNIVTISGDTVYPLYYNEKQDPPNNVTFTSMTEAEAYECPWVGMNATIAGDNYIFSGDSISGYEWVVNPSRLPTV